MKWRVLAEAIDESPKYRGIAFYNFKWLKEISYLQNLKYKII